MPTWPQGPRTSPDDEAVSPVDAVATADFAKAVWGTERAIGRGATDVGWDSSITVLYATAGIGHERRMWAVVRGSHIVGLALRTVLSTPLNFSLLDRRAEIVVAAGLSDRERVVTDLAHAVIADARAHGEPIVPLMIEATDAPAAMAAGFADDGMSYVEHLWPVTAAAEGVAAFRQLYTGRTRRHGMQAGAVA